MLRIFVPPLHEINHMVPHRNCQWEIKRILAWVKIRANAEKPQQAVTVWLCENGSFKEWRG
jgi:hypothetical protein